MSKLISISLSPNTEKDDISLAFKSLFRFWKWKRGKEINLLEENFRKYLKIKSAFSFNSGRSALMAILNSLGLEKDNEILLQVPTCNAVVNPILWSGLKPVYVDCSEDTFNIDIADLKKKINKNSKAIIIQHTFGLPVDIDKILKICKKNNLILIEDCAHSLGASYNGKKVGTFGDVSFFSFSRDKVISSVYGGMAITNDSKLAEKIKYFQKQIGLPSNFWIFQQLLHPVLMNKIIMPTYNFFGKYFLVIMQNINLLSKAVHWKEKIGEKPEYIPKAMPNILAILAVHQLKKLDRFNKHRQEIAEIYYESFKEKRDIKKKNKKDKFSSFFEKGSFEMPLKNQGQIYLRFTIKHPRAWRIIKKSWQNNILIGDWYNSIIASRGTKLNKMKYISKSCPNAEKLIYQMFNLPTHINITKQEAKEVAEFIKSLKV